MMTLEESSRTPTWTWTGTKNLWFWKYTLLVAANLTWQNSQALTFTSAFLLNIRCLHDHKLGYWRVFVVS